MTPAAPTAAVPAARAAGAAAPQRLFLALWPDAGLRRALAARRDRFAWPPGAAPVADARLHLTLHFIGDVAASRVPTLQAALQAAVPPFTLVLDRAEAWDGGLVVLRPTLVPEPLAALHAALADALRAAALPVERRGFRPHVTLARRAAGVALPALRPLRWPVAGYALVRSHPGPAPRYERLWRRPATPDREPRQRP
jgi:2'-5' RNA ligase